MDRATLIIKLGATRIGTLVFPLLLGSMVGCGESVSPAPENAAQNNASAPQTQAAPNPAGPGEAVYQYLAAVCAGDAAQVNGLLTSVARQKTAEMDIAVAPTGSDTARFEVGQVKFLTEAKQEAHVDSLWAELDETGAQQTHAITWILRQEPAGWRISGMMGQFVAGQGVTVFNFEDPEQVIRQRDASEELIRQQQGTYQARATEPPESTRR